MIYVFKTSVKNTGEVEQLRPHIDTMATGKKWNFDLEDCDNILRIESDQNIVSCVTTLLNNHKFRCEELH